MKTFASAMLALCAAAIDNTDFAFMQYTAVHGKSYGTVEEFNFRRNLFNEADAYIRSENVKNQSYKLGHNYMSDWTQAEYGKLLGYKPELRQFTNKAPVSLPTNNLVDTVNWMDKGAVTPVKDQKQCGSCWAFSTTGGLEGAHFIKSGKLASFAEQYLVDCDKVDHGCGGGLMDNAFKFFEKNFAILESDYAYTAKNGTCMSTSKPHTKVEVSTFTDVPKNNPDQMKAALMKQPVSVAIEADKAMFKLYASGILDSPSCGTHLDHGVLAIGYGKRDDGVEYYLVKNSWNTTWGDKGFIKLRIVDGAGTCGIQMQASYPEATA